MRFQEFVEQVQATELGEGEQMPERTAVLRVRELLAEALADGPDFLIDCAAILIDRLERGLDARGRGQLFSDERRGLMFRLIDWRPGIGTLPHEHTGWTVTAVVHNQLTVTTFELDVAYLRQVLERRNVFHASAGQAGYIYGQGLHCPKNLSDAVSVSFHIFSKLDRPRLQREVGPIPGLAPRAQSDGPTLAPELDEAGVDQAWRRWLAGAAAVKRHCRDERLQLMPAQCLITGILEMLAEFRAPDVLSLVRRAYVLSDLPNRHRAAFMVERFDPAQSAAWRRDLARVDAHAAELFADKSWSVDTPRPKPTPAA